MSLQETKACLDEGKRKLDAFNQKIAQDRLEEINGVINKLKNDYSYADLITVDGVEELFDLMYERKKLQERLR